MSRADHLPGLGGFVSRFRDAAPTRRESARGVRSRIVRCSPRFRTRIRKDAVDVLLEGLLHRASLSRISRIRQTKSGGFAVVSRPTPTWPSGIGNTVWKKFP